MWGIKQMSARMKGVLIENRRKCLICIVVIVLIVLLFHFLWLCPVCLISEVTGANGHFHRVQGTVKEITGEYILLEPTGRNAIRFMGKEVRLMLPTISTSGLPENLSLGELVMASYNQDRVIWGENELLLEAVFQISR